MTRKTTPHGRRLARRRAIAEHQRIDAEFQSQLTTTRIKLWGAADGDDATELLAALSVVIGTPCEAGARVHGRDAPWVRQLHGALRTLQAMCLQGYRWQPQYAPALDAALDIAATAGLDLPTPTFTAAWIEANSFAGQVLAHTVDRETIAS
jgi:hypothetical protein